MHSIEVSIAQGFFQSVDSAKRDNWEQTFKGIEKIRPIKNESPNFYEQTCMGVNVFIFDRIYRNAHIMCIAAGQREYLASRTPAQTSASVELV